MRPSRLLHMSKTQTQRFLYNSYLPLNIVESCHTWVEQMDFQTLGKHKMRINLYILKLVLQKVSEYFVYVITITSSTPPFHNIQRPSRLSCLKCMLCTFPSDSIPTMFPHTYAEHFFWNYSTFSNGVVDGSHKSMFNHAFSRKHLLSVSSILGNRVPDVYILFRECFH